MNYTTAVFLINDKARALRGTYEAGEHAPRALFKTFDPAIKKDDLVIVPTGTRHNMTVVKIVEEDVEIEIETDQPVWIVGSKPPTTVFLLPSRRPSAPFVAPRRPASAMN